MATQRKLKARNRIIINDSSQQLYHNELCKSYRGYTRELKQLAMFRKR